MNIWIIVSIILLLAVLVACHYGFVNKLKEYIKNKKAEQQKKLEEIKQKFNETTDKLNKEITGSYLNFSKFNKLQNEAKELYNSSKRFHKKLINEYPYFFSFVTDSNFRDDYNKAFIETEKSQYTNYFKKIDKNGFGLTDKQLDAVFTDEDATLINAGAGTGKTKTLENKILYLHMIKGVPLDKILVITYSKASQQDMLKRISKTLISAGVNFDADKLTNTISTFHAFGKRIVDEYCAKYGSFSDEEKLIGEGNVGKKVIEEKEQDEILELVMDRLKRNRKTQEVLANYLLYYNNPEFDVEKFNVLDDYYNTVKRLYVTLIKDYTGYNVTVKSYGEVLIANYLVSHGINVEYEPKGHYYTNDNGEKRAYKPDFYLPDYKIYIEYFGVDKDGKTAPYIATEDYVYRMNQKIENHKKSNNILIDLRYADYQNGQGFLLNKLRSELIKNNVTIKEQSHTDIINTFEGEISGFGKLLKNFLVLYKESNYTIGDLKKKILTFDRFNYERNKTFLEIFDNYLQEYSDLLLEGGYMDFGDMISDANQIITSGEIERDFSYILVDEFQDISEARAMLLKGLVKDSNKTRLFCVGDDWQSIYKFAGSNTNIFLNFEDYFGYTQKITLDRTFRFNQGISNVSGWFVMKNPKQTAKVLIANSNETKDKMLIFQKRYNGEWEYENIVQKICEDYFSKGPKSSNEISVMYLTRYFLGRYVKNHGGDFIDYLASHYNAKEITEQENDKKETYYLTDVIHFGDYEFKLKCRALTIHKSKGLEADYVITDYINQNDDYNFPSSFDDDPLLGLLLDKEKTNTLYPEERRLLYVAMTRGKNLSFLIYDKGKQSVLLNDLWNTRSLYDTVQAYSSKGQHLSLVDDIKAPKCEICGGVLRASKFTHPYQEYYCSNIFMGCDCKYYRFGKELRKAPTCPDCKTPMSLRKNSKTGHPFWGCSMYPSCKGTREF